MWVTFLIVHQRRLHLEMVPLTTLSKALFSSKRMEKKIQRDKELSLLQTPLLVPSDDEYPLMIIGVTLTFIFTFLTTVLNVIPENSIASLPLITAILSALASVSALTSEGAVIGFTSKNKSKFQNQIREMEKKYNQCYIFYEKARADQKITDEELTRFYSILSDTKEV